MIITQAYALESPKTLEELIALARSNDLQAKIDEIEIKKLEIDQNDAHDNAKKYEYAGDNRGEILRVYTLGEVDPVLADNALKCKKIDMLIHQDQLAVDVEDALSDVTLAKSALAVAEANISTLEADVKAKTLKRDLGLIIPLELIEAENALTQAKLDLLDLQNDIYTKTLALKKVVGSDFALELDTPYQISLAEAYTEDLAANIDERVTNMLSVQKAQATFDIKQGLYTITAEHYPENLSEYKRAALDLLTAKNELRTAIVNAKSNIESSYDQLQVHYKDVTVAKSLATIAVKQHKNDKLRYERGLIAQLVLDQSAQRVKQANHELLLATHTYNGARRAYLQLIKTYVVDITPVEYDSDEFFEVNDELKPRGEE